MGGVYGAIAGVIAWLGWFSVCPALGFPSLATAAMLNRVLVPREDPRFWLGWALLFIGLASAALLYLAAVGRGRLRPSIASGLVYGGLCWLLAGAVVMPLLGLAVPAPAAATGPPDPMRGSFMMLHLGLGAPIAALIAWLLFGAVLGATAGSPPSYRSLGQLAPRTSRRLVIGAAFAILAVVAIALAASLLVKTPASSPVTAFRTLASGPVDALPPGADFFSIVELPQAPGGTLGPHAHVPGFAYSVTGVETMTFDEGRTVRVGPDEAGFIGAAAPHSHLNVDDRLPAATVALLILVLAGVVCLISLRGAARAERLLSVGLALLIATGAIGIWNPWSNDWLFLSIRPEAARGAPMPLPSASRTYESPDFAALATGGPFIETLEEITLQPGAAAVDVGSAGAAALLVLSGRIAVQPAGQPSFEIGARAATLLEAGASVQVSTPGDRQARVLRFSVTPAVTGGAQWTPTY
jgi:quercetin dioxygenase-like cupin family protein